MADLEKVEEVVEQPTTEAAPEAPAPTDRERLEARFDKEVASQAGAAEPVAAVEEAAEGATATAATNPDGSQKPAAAADPKESEKLVLTEEQLADSKYWGSLDADGWKRMERDYPVQTKLVKSAQAAAAKIVNGARKEAPKPAEEERHEAPSEEEPSAELIAAVEMSQDLDPKVAAKGHLLIAKLTAPTVLEEGGIDPQRVKADAILAVAIVAARKELPELAKIDLLELDEIAEERPELKRLCERGTAEDLQAALVAAGRIHIERSKTAAATKKAADEKAAADLKKKEHQKIVQSNASPASAAVLRPHGATPDTRTDRERLAARFDKEVARQGGGNA